HWPALYVEEVAQHVADSVRLAQACHLLDREAAHAYHGAVVAGVADADECEIRLAGALQRLADILVVQERIAHASALGVGRRVEAFAGAAEAFGQSAADVV